MLWGFRALISNITLALELKETGRLKANSIGRTLFFNTFASLGPTILAAGLAVTVSDIDPNMKWYQHGCNVSIAVSFFFICSSTLSVSVVWIIDVQKTATLDMGPEAVRHKKWQERVFLTSAYAISLSAAALVVVISIFSDLSTGSLLTLLGVLYSAVVGASYHFAGKRVIRDLRIVIVGAFSFVSFHILEYTVIHLPCFYRQAYQCFGRKTSLKLRRISKQQVKS